MYAGIGKQWAVVMSRCNEYKDQVIELDFLYPSEGIHRRWDEGTTASLLLLHRHLLLSSKGTCAMLA